MDIVGISIIIINVLIAILMPLSLAPVMVWWERRIAGFIQDRPGPNRANIGGIRLGGLIQSFADMLKLAFKEDFTSDHIKHKTLYNIAPAIVFFCAVLTFAVVPFADNLTLSGTTYIMQGIPIDLGVMWILGFAGLSVYGIIIGGWASNNKYSLLGGIRASSQVISYEAAMGLAIISMLITYGSINLNDMVTYQSGTFFGIPAWGIFLQPLAFIIFVVTAFAETNRAPFDLAEAESELVAGFHTEYGAMRFGLFFVGEYVALSVASALIVSLFLGGYHIPYLDTATMIANSKLVAFVLLGLFPLVTFLFLKWVKKNNNWPNKNDPRALETKKLVKFAWFKIAIVSVVLVGFLIFGGDNGSSILVAIIQILTFLFKLLLLNFVFVWVRWTLPRFRYDQLQSLGWKILLPLSLANIFITAFVVVVFNV
jgi:NADH-quinone oxidoreductase subunit H